MSVRRWSAVVALGLVVGVATGTTAPAAMATPAATTTPAAVAVPAAVADAPVSQATGRFLSGQIGPATLDSVVAIKGASAVNTGGGAMTEQHPLSASLLGQPLLNLPNGVQLPGGGVLTLGTVNQYAQADPDGSAHGASGAVTDSGAIGFGNGGAPQSNATLVLGDVPAVPGVSTGGIPSIGKLTASIGALAATAGQAKGSSGAQTGHYELAGLTLTVGSPLLADVMKQLADRLAGLLGQLSGTSGLPVSGTTLFGCDLASMSQALARFGTFSYGGAITGSLTGGTLTIDVGRLVTSLLGVDLNDLPPNTHVFSYLARALPQALAGGLTQLQGTLSTQFDQLAGLGTSACPSAPDVTPVSQLGQQALGVLLQPLRTSLRTGAASLSPLFAGLAKQLEQLLDPIVNVQERNGGTFTERALQLNLAGDPAAQLNLASASVGPSRLRVAAPGPAPATHAPAAAAPNQHLASTGPDVVLTKIALFGLLGVCLGAALFGATIGVRRRGPSGVD